MHQTEKKLQCEPASQEFQKTINILFDFTDKEEVLSMMDSFFMEFILSLSEVEVKRDYIFNHTLVYQLLHKMIRLAEPKSLKLQS